MSILMPSSNSGSGYITLLNWRKITAIVLCFSLVFGYLPASGAVLSDRTLGSIVGFGLGEVSEAAVQQDGATDPMPAENDQPQSATPELVVSKQASPLSEEQVILPSEGEPATADDSYSDALPESSGISSEDQTANGTFVSTEEATITDTITAQENILLAEQHEPGSTETVQTQLQQAQEQLAETIKPETDGMVLQSTAYTCGPAALATLLKMMGSGDNYYQQISELAQAGQNGTSLLTLRRSVEALGYQAAGYRLNIKELAAAGPVLAHVVIGGYHHFTVVEGIADEAVFLADPQLGRVSIPVEQFKGMWSGAVLKISEARPIEAAPTAKECDKTSDAAKHPVVPAGTEPVGPALTTEAVANLTAEEMSGAQEAVAAAGVEAVGTPTAARQQYIVSVPESTVLLPEITAAAELPATELPVPTSLKEHADFTQERPSSSSQLLAETEMAEIEGRGIFLVPVAPALKAKAATLAATVGRSVTIGTVTGQVRVDLIGKAHFDKAVHSLIPAPHVHIFSRHLNPKNPALINFRLEQTRPATFMDLRNVSNVIQRRGWTVK